MMIEQSQSILSRRESEP